MGKWIDELCEMGNVEKVTSLHIQKDYRKGFD